jgi:hypothetical protein
MRFILFLALFAWGQTACSQDSTSLKITRIKTVADGKIVVWLKDVNTNFPYVFQCPCTTLPPGYIKGNIIKLPSSKMVVIKESFTRKDLEN